MYICQLFSNFVSTRNNQGNVFWWGDVFHIQTVSTRNNTFQCRRMFRKVAVNCIEITKVYNKSFICLARGQLPHPRERTYLQRKNLSGVARQGLIAPQRYRCRWMATLRLRIITGNTTRLLRACACLRVPHAIPPSCFRSAVSTSLLCGSDMYS